MTDSEYDGYCPCRDCAGDPCTCAWGDHCDAKGPYCSCCHTMNYGLLGIMGARARWAKAWGITEAEVNARWDARAEAEMAMLG